MDSRKKKNGAKALLLLCGVILLLAGLWIRIQTWGVRILYVHTLLGRYYWICYWLCGLGIICIVIGWKVKWQKNERKQEQTIATGSEEKAVKTREETNTETVSGTEILCPVCGTRLPVGAVFCKKCGNQINNKEEG